MIQRRQRSDIVNHIKFLINMLNEWSFVGDEVHWLGLAPSVHNILLMRSSSSFNRMKSFVWSKLLFLFLCNFLLVSECHFYDEHVPQPICVWVRKIVADSWIIGKVGSSAVKSISSIIP